MKKAKSKSSKKPARKSKSREPVSCPINGGLRSGAGRKSAESLFREVCGKLDRLEDLMRVVAGAALDARHPEEDDGGVKALEQFRAIRAEVSDNGQADSTTIQLQFNPAEPPLAEPPHDV